MFAMDLIQFFKVLITEVGFSVQSLQIAVRLTAQIVGQLLVPIQGGYLEHFLQIALHQTV
jgi:hypothetical protein